MFLKNLNRETKFLFLLIILNPIFDLLIGILQSVSNNSFSYGGYFRFFTVFAIAIYYIMDLIKFGTRKSRINFSIICILFTIYLLMFGINSYRNFGLSITIQQFVYLVRYMSFLVFLIGLRPLIAKINRDSIYKVLLFTSLIYSMLIIIPFLTNTGFSSYEMQGLKGSVGWFSGANEIGFIIGFTSLISIYSVLSKDNIGSSMFLKLMTVFIPSFALVLIGTKAALLFCVIYFLFIFWLLWSKLNWKYKTPVFVCILIGSSMLLLITPAFKNIFLILEGKSIDRLFHILLSGRVTFFNRTYLAFQEAPLFEKLFGIGFMTLNDTGKVVVDKLVEMDFFDIFFRMGIVGSGLYLTTIIIQITELKSVKRIINLEFVVVLTNILIAVVLSFLIGHVFSAPSVGFFLAIYIIIFLDKLDFNMERGD